MKSRKTTMPPPLITGVSSTGNSVRKRDTRTEKGQNTPSSTKTSPQKQIYTVAQIETSPQKQSSRNCSDLNSDSQNSACTPVEEDHDKRASSHLKGVLKLSTNYDPRKHSTSSSPSKSTTPSPKKSAIKKLQFHDHSHGLSDIVNCSETDIPHPTTKPLNRDTRTTVNNMSPTNSSNPTFDSSDSVSLSPLKHTRARSRATEQDSGCVSRTDLLTEL